MVEFAMVLPVFMLVLSGILDFGFMLYNRMTVISAAREGARAAAMVESADAAVSAATGAAQAAASTGGVAVSTGNVSVACLQTSVSVSSPPACTFDTSPSTGAKNGDSVKVTVTYTYAFFIPLAIGATFPLSSTVQMVFDNLPT